jgi:hypothetical protein
MMVGALALFLLLPALLVGASTRYREPYDGILYLISFWGLQRLVMRDR